MSEELDDIIDNAENDGLYDRLQETATRICKEMGLDTIQVFATVMKGESTLTLAVGNGNWEARCGQVRHWNLRVEHKEARGE